MHLENVILARNIQAALLSLVSTCLVKWGANVWLVKVSCGLLLCKNRLVYFEPTDINNLVAHCRISTGASGAHTVLVSLMFPCQ